MLSHSIWKNLNQPENQKIDEKDIALTIATINKKINNNEKFMIGHSSCSSFSRENILYFDDTVVLFSFPNQYVYDTGLDDGTRLQPDLFLVRRSEFNKIGTQEITSFSTSDSYYSSMKQCLLADLNVGKEKRQAEYRAIQLLQKLYPRNSAIKSMKVLLANRNGPNDDLQGIKRSFIASEHFSKDNIHVQRTLDLLKKLQQKNIISLDLLSCPYARPPKNYYLKLEINHFIEFQHYFEDLAKGIQYQNNDNRKCKR